MNPLKCVPAILYPLLFCALSFAPCKKEDHISRPAVTAESEKHNTATLHNYISNPDFTDVDSSTLLPLDWQPYFEHNYLLGINKTGAGITWERNATGQYFLTQQVALQKNKFYKVAATCQYNIKNYDKGGLYIMDQKLQKVLGKIERFNASGKETFELIFNSGEDETITVVLGFLEGMNANISFDNIYVTEYKFSPVILNSVFANHLVSSLKLSFNEKDFDASIERIADYINQNLLCEYKGGNCTTQTNRLLNLLDPEAYFFFIENLKNLSSIDVAYCQRSSLSFAEVLSNEFNIPVRQVHMNIEGTGFHQFPEYWNPYQQKWLAIDPYFSVRFVKDGVLLSANEITAENLLQVKKNFGSSSFPPATEEELIWLWQTTDNLWIGSNSYISYPYSNNRLITRKKQSKYILNTGKKISIKI